VGVSVDSFYGNFKRERERERDRNAMLNLDIWLALSFWMDARKAGGFKETLFFLFNFFI
jgi:hypothetical protein